MDIIKRLKLKPVLLGKIKHRRLTQVLLTRPAKRKDVTIEEYLDRLIITKPVEQWLEYLYSNLVILSSTSDKEKIYIANALKFLEASWLKEIT